MSATRRGQTWSNPLCRFAGELVQERCREARTRRGGACLRTGSSDLHRRLRPGRLRQRRDHGRPEGIALLWQLSLIHISEPTRLGMISYAVFCLKKKKIKQKKKKRKKK